jgi:hypothetical protein
MKVRLSVSAACLAAVLASGAVMIAGSPQQNNAPPGKAKKPSDPAAPFPDAAALADKRKSAEERPLFSTDTPLEFTLTADFKTVNKDRNPNSTKVFPATITVAKSDGTPTTFPLNIRTRGHVRRLTQTCTFAPLRLEFDAQQTKGTVFEGHKNIKLGTHCRDADLFEQYVPREYAAYRLFNLLTPRSFRARLAKATYLDAATNKPVATRMAIFIEDDDDVAKRLEGRITEQQKLVFRQVDYDTATLMTLFEYMIGNTDMSMYLLHNVVLVQTPGKVTYPVPYDFDYSGLVDARYAIPAKQFNITSVRDRVYRGPCRTPAELEPFFAKFNEIKPQALALFDSILGLDAGYRKDSQKYIEAFYQTISKPNEVKKAFVDDCNNRAGM